MACGVAGALFCLMSAVPCPACQIPVFRYALERWPADAFRIEVAPLEAATAAERAALVQLEDGAAINGGPCNYVVTRMPDAAGPEAVTVLPPRGTIPVWTGSLTEASAAVAAGPAHQELVRRLLAGDAIVWLVLVGTDGAAGRARELLEMELPVLANDTVLPRRARPVLRPLWTLRNFVRLGCNISQPLSSSVRASWRDGPLPPAPVQKPAPCRPGSRP